MIHEYALDPALLDNWERIRYYTEKFGHEKRRHISRFPKRWKKMVWDGLGTVGDIERKRSEVYLSHIDRLLVGKDRAYNGDLPWLDNAEQEHRRKPFKAVLSTQNPRGHEVVVPNHEFSESHPLLCFPVQERVTRTPIALAEFLTPILAGASKVLLIDPYFHPQPDTNIHTPIFRANRRHLPLIEFLRRVRDGCHVEYHALRQTSRGSRVPIGDENARDMDSWAESCTTALPHILPHGAKVTVFRWQELQGGRQFHARYLVTDQCAVSVDPGLDADRNTANEFVEITYLNDAKRLELEARFAAGATEYALLSKHEVVGIGDCSVYSP